jgi:hypothetical protein
MLELVSSPCCVSSTDGAGITHTVSVSAAPLYEAAALALAEFEKCGFAMMIAGPGTRLTVDVEAPTTTQVLTVAKLQSWLDTNGKTPREQAVKATLRQMLRRE